MATTKNGVKSRINRIALITNQGKPTFIVELENGIELRRTIAQMKYDAQSTGEYIVGIDGLHRLNFVMSNARGGIATFDLRMWEKGETYIVTETSRCLDREHPEYKPGIKVGDTARALTTNYSCESFIDIEMPRKYIMDKMEAEIRASKSKDDTDFALDSDIASFTKKVAGEREERRENNKDTSLKGIKKDESGLNDEFLPKDIVTLKAELDKLKSLAKPNNEKKARMVELETMIAELETEE